MEVLNEPGRNTYRIAGLVRDGVFKSMKDMDHRPYPEDGDGASLSIHKQFKDKLAEELMELREPQPLDGKLGEAADVMAVWDSYGRVAIREELEVDMSLFHFVEEALEEARKLGLDIESIRHRQAEIRDTKGEFDGMYYVETVSPPRGDRWDKHYRDNPSRFPIVTQG